MRKWMNGIVLIVLWAGLATLPVYAQEAGSVEQAPSGLTTTLPLLMGFGVIVVVGVWTWWQEIKRRRNSK